MCNARCPERYGSQDSTVRLWQTGAGGPEVGFAESCLCFLGSKSVWVLVVLVFVTRTRRFLLHFAGVPKANRSFFFCFSNWLGIGLCTFV